MHDLCLHGLYHWIRSSCRTTGHQQMGRLVALWLCYFQGLGFSMSLTIVSSNIAGYTKKQVTGALLFTGYCVGNIIGPQTFKSSEAPGYNSAYIAYVAIRLYIKP